MNYVSNISIQKYYVNVNKPQNRLIIRISPSQSPSPQLQPNQRPLSYHSEIVAGKCSRIIIDRWPFLIWCKWTEIRVIWIDWGDIITSNWKLFMQINWGCLNVIRMEINYYWKLQREANLLLFFFSQYFRSRVFDSMYTCILHHFRNKPKFIFFIKVLGTFSEDGKCSSIQIESTWNIICSKFEHI